MGVEEGAPLKEMILEFYYKSDELGDPMLNEDHIRAFNLASEEEIKTLKERALKINDLLLDFFDEKGIRLIDFKLEFGKNKDGIFLGDEITPDGCRLWDKETNEKMDKDRFRRDLGKIEESYREVFRRICG
jgi:phosphoribosylaminoimidazole-succinocarboxamide synthase